MTVYKIDWSDYNKLKARGGPFKTTLKKSIVLAVDEFGGTSGMITMEDVPEEIIADNYQT